jgi:hypothetical protein
MDNFGRMLHSLLESIIARYLFHCAKIIPQQGVVLFGFALLETSTIFETFEV